jgi:hypothetical protein
MRRLSRFAACIFDRRDGGTGHRGCDLKITISTEYVGPWRGCLAYAAPKVTINVMDRPRIYRRLRITLSAMCLVVCTLLIALWVRSYYWRDSIYGRVNSKLIHAISMEGQIELSRFAKQNHPMGLYTGQVRHSRLEQWKRLQIQMFPAPPEPTTIVGFGLRRTIPQGISIYAPYWFLVLLSAAFATAPWVRWPKRFSLRTLLIVTTLIAVLLGLAVYAPK